jgi:steroid 5-alpha reductase family enzyme
VLCIPACYIANHLTGNVSSVDRIYTTWPVLCSILVGSWARGPYIASLPRVVLAILIQVGYNINGLTQFVWSARLTYHSARRGFYNPWMEDYRYPIVRRLVPKWFFEVVVHILAVVVAQPLLLLTLSFPLASTLLPATQLSKGPFPAWHVTLAFFRPLWDTARAHAVPLDTPVLHAGDALCALAALAAVWTQKKTDDAMYAYQEAKHAAMDKRRPERPAETGVPLPVDVPAEFYPGFPTGGIHAVVRHANFTSEQSFWLAQGLLGLGAGPVAPRAGGCLLPPFLLSCLFLGSTTLTEWITSHRVSRLIGSSLTSVPRLQRVQAARGAVYPDGDGHQVPLDDAARDAGGAAGAAAGACEGRLDSSLRSNRLLNARTRT